MYKKEYSIMNHNYTKLAVITITYILIVFINYKIMANTSGPFQQVIRQISVLASMFIFGIMIGLDCILERYNAKGKWLFNKKRILILGLPLLIVIIYFFGIDIMEYLTVSPIKIPHELPLKLAFLQVNDYSFWILPLLLGYIITTSFEKELVD